MLPVRSVPISCPARSPLRSPVIGPHRIACISACLAVFLVCLFGILPAQAASIPLFGTATWDSFKQGAQGKSGMELLRYVNTFWNRFPYREDITNWGKADYWVWPNLFLKKSGDCEDYAIVKYFTLKELGMDTDKLRIVVLRDTLRRLSHAVLAVYMDNDIVILDNISNAILPQGRLRHYVPQFSFNEKSRWAHMRGKKTNE